MGTLADDLKFASTTAAWALRFVLRGLWLAALLGGVAGVVGAVLATAFWALDAGPGTREAVTAFTGVLMAIGVLFLALCWAVGAGPFEAGPAAVTPTEKGTRDADVLPRMEGALVRHWERLTAQLVALDAGLVGAVEADTDKGGDMVVVPATAAANDEIPTREAITTALHAVEDQLYRVRRMRAPLPPRAA
ncbi:hypothetical protein Q8F55_007598 [Vanrija albida]|uniref:Uncharacterized protein n=1 Tax=Vanrija albida TaxID=181172 RepID=A0ABR3PUZ4_9TREE